MLFVEGLTKRYGSVLALNDVGFEVEPGQTVGFLGPNGAGKTTTMRAIMRLLTLDAGRVTWQGQAVDRAVCRRFGYMPAERGMYQRMRVRDHLVYYARLSGRSKSAAGQSADEWLDRLDLTERADDAVQQLSSGNQQRVQLALALLDEPELLILDEPFSGLDPLATERLVAVLRSQVQRGAALLLSSHQLDLVADVCSTVIIVDRGQVVLRGDVADLRARSAARYVDVEFAEPTRWQAAGAVAIDDGRRYRLEVGQDADPGDLIAAAGSHGRLVSFTFAPPSLSDVFLRAVGRAALEDDEPVGTAS
ncbi:MAG: ATP-binding cassette domain-containing protein [Actinomycetota bacterium]|nr:MAG: ATP-binding cassette domain-containing protein [Actinomycetota bacterium]